MKSFKIFLKESEDRLFNGFVEETLSNNKISLDKAKDFLTPEYNYKGILYRVTFHPKNDIEKYFLEDYIDTKNITKYIVNKFNPDRYVFFSKSLEGIKNLINYPNLFNVSENQIGVIFSIKPAASIDLTKYTGKNIEIKKRLELTKEVLSFEDRNIKNIDALYIFLDGWKFVTNFDEIINFYKIK